jgi:opacity protein-like surface antigen
VRAPLIATIIAILASTAVAQAATDDPCTSLNSVVTRPSVTNSVCTVEPNHVLLETGYTNLTYANGGPDVTYPQASLRIGTDIRHLEVDLNGPVENRTGGAVGLGDIGAGLKYIIGYSPKMQYGAQFSFTSPTGTQQFSAGASQETLAFNASYILSPSMTLSSTQNYARLATNGTSYGSYIPSLILGASLPHNLGVFAEAAAFTNAAGPKTSTRYQYMLGATYDVTSRLQLDVENITSPTKSTGKYNGVGVGVAYMVH